MQQIIIYPSYYCVRVRFGMCLGDSILEIEVNGKYLQKTSKTT